MNPQTTNEASAGRSALQPCLARRSKSEAQTPKSQNSKGGRPKKEKIELHPYSVKVYFDEKSYRALLRKRNRTGMSLSSLVYELAVNGYVKEAIPKEVLPLLRSLAGMANNLNQLAHMAHTYGYHHANEQVSTLAKRVDDLLIQISEK